MPPKDEGISTGLAMKIGEIIGKLDQLIKSVDESKIEHNRRIDELEARVDELEAKADAVAGGAKGVGLVATTLKDYLFPAALAVLAFFGAHYVYDKHDEQAVKPVVVNPPPVILQQAEPKIAPTG